MYTKTVKPFHFSFNGPNWSSPYSFKGVFTDDVNGWTVLPQPHNKYQESCLCFGIFMKSLGNDFTFDQQTSCSHIKDEIVDHIHSDIAVIKKNPITRIGRPHNLLSISPKGTSIRITHIRIIPSLLLNNNL